MFESREELFEEAFEEYMRENHMNFYDVCIYDWDCFEEFLVSRFGERVLTDRDYQEWMEDTMESI